MRSNNIIKRLRMAIKLLVYGKGSVRIMTCGRCGSINITPIVDSDAEDEIPLQLEERGVKRIWHEVDICQNCGAQVVEKQYWVWD